MQKIRKVADNCRQLSARKVLEVNADLLNDNEVNNLLNKTIEEFGRLDALFNCVQISIPFSITDERMLENYEKVFNTNVRSVVLLTKLALPHIELTKGCVVNLSSDSGLKPVTQFTIKQGLEMKSIIGGSVVNLIEIIRRD